MVRLLLILLAALVLAAGIFLALVFALDRLGWYPLFDAQHHLIQRSLLEVGKFLPGILAFTASLVAAGVAMHLVTLQEAANRELGRFTSDLSDQVETLRMQIGLSQRDADRVSLNLNHALKTAAAYLTLLQQLDGGTFEAEAVHAAERAARQSAAVLDAGSAVQGAYEEFLDTGSDIADRAKAVVTWYRRKQVWKDLGTELSDRFIELQTRIDEARVAPRSETPRAAAPPSAPAASIGE